MANARIRNWDNQASWDASAYFATDESAYSNARRLAASILDSRFAATAGDTFTGAVIFQDAITIQTANGIDLTPGSDIDVDLLTVNVTGGPKNWWDESEDAFRWNTYLYCTGVRTEIATGNVTTDIEPIVTDGSSIARVRFFRNTNTSGSVEFDIKAGDGSTNNMHTLSSTGVIFNEQGQDIDLRIESNDEVYMFFLDAGNNRIGIQENNPSGALHVNQSGSSRSVPALYLEQADISEEFIRLRGSAASGVLTQSIVAEADVTTATRAGFIKAYVQDDGNQITDQAYFVAIYTLA